MNRTELQRLLARLQCDAAQLRHEARNCASDARGRNYWNRHARIIERRAASVAMRLARLIETAANPAIA